MSEYIPVCLLHERLNWMSIVEHLPSPLACFEDRKKNFSEYSSAMLILLLCKAVEANPLTLAANVLSIEYIRGINQRIYRVSLSSFDAFEDDFDTSECAFVHLETIAGGKFAIKTMASWCIERDVRRFELVGDLHQVDFEVWSTTFGGCIFDLLHRTQCWPQRELDAGADSNFTRFLRGMPYEDFSNLTKARDPHEFFGLSVTDDFLVKKTKYQVFLFRSDPANFKSLYPWMCNDERSRLFAGFLSAINLTCKTAWKEIMQTRDEVIRPSKRRKCDEEEEEELDFSTFPLTHRAKFELKDKQGMFALLQRMFCDFLSETIICAENGQMYEKTHRNGIEYETPDYLKETNTDILVVDFTNHPRHLLDGVHVDQCVFCRYDYCKNLIHFPEFVPFFEKASQCMACKSGKSMFGEVHGNNGGKILDKSLVAFQNVYFDIVKLKFIKIESMPKCGRIAVINHTDKALPENFILDEASLDSEGFFDKNKQYIPVFSRCLGQTENVTRCLLADIGSGFIPRNLHDSYQKGTFILGPGGRGKSEYQKILRHLHGNWNCITPCQNTLGQKFSHGQFAGSLKTGFFPDEIHKECGLSQQMWYNWVDQTEIQCEMKYKQKLKTLPFVLSIVWVANAFFPKFELSEALLRRALVFDVNFFTFMKFTRTPSSLVEKTEVRLHKLYLKIAAYRRRRLRLRRWRLRRRLRRWLALRL